ncbi:MAG: FHA domain-containing protein [Bacteroidales bacterium]|nr:FHA domain-containing protein [Bacteroidales bacterium]
MLTSSHIGSNIIPERCDYNPGDQVACGYVVEKALGEGSFGVVYKVKDVRGNTWAMKLLRLWDVPASIRQPLISRFEMEYKTSCIKSRNLVHSVDYGLVKGNPYIVMEYCAGGDLVKFVGKEDAPLVRIARDVLNGLHDLHVNGKVHRDLKPENVLFKEDGTAVLTDFGISGDRNKRMTERNIFGKPTQIFGTYAYMPPEQVNPARGNSTVLPTTDLYSFGVMMYQLITGYLPFGKLDDQNDLVHYQKRGKAGDWDRMRLLMAPHGRDWEHLISKCLIPDHKERVHSAGDAMALLPYYNDPVLSSKAVTPKVVEPDPVKQHEPDGIKRLKVMQGKEFGKEYLLEDIITRYGRKVLGVGRDEANAIVIEDYDESYVSRRHCVIEMLGESFWQIRDGQWNSESMMWKTSMNGTYVNSDVVTQNGRLLKNGDIITIGDVKLKIEL